MSEPPRLPPSGSGSSPPLGTHALTSATRATVARLQVGMHVELLPSRSLTPELLEARLRPLDGSQSWTPSVRVQLITALSASALQGATANARSASGMPPTPLRAEVVATGPTLVLRLTAADPPTLPSKPLVTLGSRDWLGQQFRQHWPESRPLAATLERLTAQLAQATGAETTGATPLQRHLSALIGQLATATELTDPEQLTVAVGRSGLWLEAHLAQAASNPAQAIDLRSDLKAQLLTLAQQLRFQGARHPSPLPPGQTAVGRSTELGAPPPGPAATPLEAATASRPGRPAEPGGSRPGATTPESFQPSSAEDEPVAPPPRVGADSQRASNMARDVEGMLKQVVTKQLQSLDAPAGQNQWLLELPFRTPSGLLALEADIRRESAQTAKEQDAWSLRLRLDLPKLGPLNILLTWRAERLNASLQAADPAGAEQIKQHLDELRTRLEARAIEVASLHAGHRPRDRAPPPFDDPLVREQA